MLIPVDPISELENSIRFESIEGMDISAPANKISDTNCSIMLNCVLDEERTPDKRPGFKKVLPLSLGLGN
jgi:hypothetical protein